MGYSIYVCGEAGSEVSGFLPIWTNQNGIRATLHLDLP